MTSTAQLKTYREVRDVVGEIHQAAAAVDEHVGGFKSMAITSRSNMPWLKRSAFS